MDRKRRSQELALSEAQSNAALEQTTNVVGPSIWPRITRDFVIPSFMLDVYRAIAI
jgi:hypothetical protein